MLTCLSLSIALIGAWSLPFLLSGETTTLRLYNYRTGIRFHERKQKVPASDSPVLVCALRREIFVSASVYEHLMRSHTDKGEDRCDEEKLFVETSPVRRNGTDRRKCRGEADTDEQADGEQCHEPCKHAWEWRRTRTLA